MYQVEKGGRPSNIQCHQNECDRLNNDPSPPKDVYVLVLITYECYLYIIRGTLQV
jgi:hypothetical protein